MQNNISKWGYMKAPVVRSDLDSLIWKSGVEHHPPTILQPLWPANVDFFTEHKMCLCAQIKRFNFWPFLPCTIIVYYDKLLLFVQQHCDFRFGFIKVSFSSIRFLAVSHLQFLKSFAVDLQLFFRVFLSFLFTHRLLLLSICACLGLGTKIATNLMWSMKGSQVNLYDTS